MRKPPISVPFFGVRADITQTVMSAFDPKQISRLENVTSASDLSGHQVRPSLQRRWPSLIPNALAFWRNEPAERFISLEIFFTRSLSFEYRLSSATRALVQATRFVRRRLAFLAIRLSMKKGW